MRTLISSLLAILPTLAAPLAVADVVGVQLPLDWTRGDSGTAFAEFDSFAGFVGGIGQVAATAQAGFTSAQLAQSGSIVTPGGVTAGGDRLYVHSYSSSWSLTGTVGFDITRAILQVKESTGSGTLAYTATLAGFAPSSVSVYSDGGSTPDSITRYVWDLSSIGAVLTNPAINLSGPGFTFISFDSFSLDLASAAPVPLPAAAWLLGGGLAVLNARRRRSA